MDTQILEKSVIAWLNLFINSSPIHNIDQINDSVLLSIIKKIKSDFEKNPVEFLKEIYPNLNDCQGFKLSSGTDYMCAATLLLIYVSLCQNPDLNEFKTQMCTKLDNAVQLNILEILKKLQQYENFFCLPYYTIKHKIFPEIFMNFAKKHSRQQPLIGDGVQTPIKQNLSDSICDSPLQEFFQTPKRGQINRFAYNMCGDGDCNKKIQSLTDLLNEEELAKTSLEEQLNLITQKCSEYETKLKNKVEEINLLKLEWENDSKKNEGEINGLKNNMKKMLDEEKKRKNELCYYEKYVSTLESDLSASASEYDKLKNQLNLVLDRCCKNELQLQEATELNLKFENIIQEKEKALQQFRDIYANFYNDEKAIDVSFVNKSLDMSESTGENLGVVMDAVLKEENASLKKTISEIRLEKDSLVNEVQSLKEKLAAQTAAIARLELLNEELNLKFEHLQKTENDLGRLQEKLLKANAEINKLLEENSKTNTQYGTLQSTLKQVLSCEKLKKVFQINFVNLAEEFKASQQRLEWEIKKISKLTVNSGEKLPHNEKDEQGNGFFHLKVLKNTNSRELNDLSETSLSGSYLICGGDNLDNLVDILKKFEICQSEWSDSKIQMEKTCNHINFNIINLKDKIRELESWQKQTMKEKEEIQQNLQKAVERMSEIEVNNASKIKALKKELEEKESKIKELESHVLQSQQMLDELTSERDKLKHQINTFNREEVKVVCKGGDPKNLHQIETEVVFNKEAKTFSSELQEFDDSLEEVPVTSKTFDIVNLEERNVGNRTFSIKKDERICNLGNKSNSTWVISPPPKVPVKETVKNQVYSDSWVIPLKFDKVKENKAKKVSSSVNDLRVKAEDLKISELQKEILILSKECECLKLSLMESEQKRKKDKETYEKNCNNIKQSVTTKYENQLEHLKSEMKHLYTKEMAKQSSEKNNLIVDLQEQNKRYKEHIDGLRNQLWDLGEKLLQEQALKRDLERNFRELKEKYENLLLTRDSDEKGLLGFDISRQKDPSTDEIFRKSALSQLTNTAFPTIPTEDEDEIFDNIFLEDMKKGICIVERAEDRLKELQYRNSLCLPHLKSSYPGETQFHNPNLFKESDLKFGNLQFGQESQSLTDSDHSMTKSLLPDSKGKKKEQTSYRKPGPPTPSKNGGRLSLQSGDLKLTPRNVLRELCDQNERNKGTPNPLKIFRSGRSLKVGNAGVKDENTVPVTPRKKIKFFRKPFGARDN